MKTVNETLDVIARIVAEEMDALESFDAATLDRDGELQALVGAIEYVPGQPASADAVDEFAAIRIAYVDSWEARAKCARISAEKQFQRVCARAGIVKPQTGEALKKQAQREAAKQAAPASKGAQLPTAKPTTPVKSNAGETATAAVMIALSVTENEIIRLIRAGEFALVHAKIKSMEPAML